jgi:aminoglycoside 3-N-acetyltransferase
MPSVKPEDIVHALEEMGLPRESDVFMHSSLSSMGKVEGGARTVIDAILSWILPGGTFMVPTFTFGGTIEFNIQTSSSKTGAITEAVRLLPQAARSTHPTHAPCAIGPKARKLMRRHLLAGPLDIGSPEDLMAKGGGWVLLLGVTHTSNSTVHVGEAYAGSYSRLMTFSPLNPGHPVIVDAKGVRRRVTQTSMPGCSQGFSAIEDPMRDRGMIRDGKIGDATCQLMKGQDIIDVAIAMLADDPLALLCDNDDCLSCGRLRRFLAATG